jgi:hypothetical protein
MRVGERDREKNNNNNKKWEGREMDEGLSFFIHIL